jgi:hypothetical protein
MSPAQRRAKFLACAANGVRPLSEARAAEIVDVMTRLEELADVGELTRLLV